MRTSSSPLPFNPADFAWTHRAKWIDHMVVSGEAGVEGPEDINDDLARETHFYEQALASANVAIRKMKDLGIAVRRPEDFYAEMVKSDEHMKRVRAELIFEQTSQVSRRTMRAAHTPRARNPPPAAHAPFLVSLFSFFVIVVSACKIRAGDGDPSSPSQTTASRSIFSSAHQPLPPSLPPP